MSLFNRKNTRKTVNSEDFPAYPMEKKKELVTAVLTTLFGEPKFYGSTDEKIVQLATESAKSDPEFLFKLTCYARNVGNLRSVSHVLACVIAREAREYTRPVIRSIVVRPDDITEIMSCYRLMYGKPFPNAMKREIAQVIQRFDEYGLAKYNRKHASMKFRDVLRITHPTPRDEQTATLFRKVLDDTLETPYTWETVLSERGNTKEVWEELIASGQVGYMALLRNLRNIVESGADVSPVLKLLSDPEMVKKSRQLPFRFLSAYLMLRKEELVTPEIHDALEQALLTSVDNMETIPGRTLIAVDVSGSMGLPVSRKSIIRSSDIAVLLGALSNRLCEEAVVCYFDCPGHWSALPEHKGYMIRQFEKDASVLDICANYRCRGGGTEMDLPMLYALENDPEASRRPFDRIVYFSDNECNRAYDGLNKTVQGMVDRYRKRYNPDFWVHGVDLQGYGTQQFCGKHFNLIAGWSDYVLPFINQAEKGFDSLVRQIEAYQAG